MDRDRVMGQAHRLTMNDRAEGPEPRVIRRLSLCHRQVARKPVIEVLEARALMASIQFLNSGATLTDMLNNPDNPGSPSETAEIPIDDLSSTSGYQQLGSPSGPPLSLARIGVNSSTDFVGPFFHTLMIFYGNYSPNPSYPTMPTSATANLTGGTAQIVAGPGEQTGDPVEVEVSAYVTDENGRSAERPSGGSFSGTLSVQGGQGQSFSFSAGLGQPNDETTSKSATLMLHVGGTINISFNGTGSSPGTTADLAVEFDADIQVISEAKIVPTTPTWNSSDGGVDYGYTISGANLSQATTVALYWASTTSFDSSQDTLIPASVVNTEAAVGTYGPFHRTPAQLGTPPQGAKYLLAVTDPDNLVTGPDPSKVESLDVSTDIQVTNLNLNYTESLVLGAIKASVMGNLGLDARSSTFDLEGDVTVTNSGHFATGPFDLTVFSSAGTLYDPSNDPTYRALLNVPVASIGAGQTLDISLQGVTNPMLFLSGDKPFYQDGFQILAVANKQGVEESEQPAVFDPSTAQVALATVFQEVFGYYDQVFRATHSGMPSSAGAAMFHYLDASGTPLDFGPTTANEAANDAAFQAAEFDALKYVGEQLKGGRRHESVSVSIPQTVIGTPALGNGASGNIPATYEFDLKTSIHGTQGSDGEFKGTVETLGKGRRHKLKVKGTLAIRLFDVYEFDNSDVFQGGLNTLARSLATFGLAKSFSDSVTMNIPIDKLIESPQPEKPPGKPILP
jgi:hypothetical protein